MGQLFLRKAVRLSTSPQGPPELLEISISTTGHARR
jgi:hypothetical protein